MYSNELMKYLYSYNMPQKLEECPGMTSKGNSGKSDDVLKTLEKFKNIYAAVPVKFNHE